jgi:hypothetical protein
MDDLDLQKRFTAIQGLPILVFAGTAGVPSDVPSGVWSKQGEALRYSGGSEAAMRIGRARSSSSVCGAYRNA